MPRPGQGGRTVYYNPPDGLGHGMSYDRRVALARELLQRSGFAGPGARAIRISYAKDPPSQERIAEAVQAMWQSALGIRVELDRIERKVLSARIRALDLVDDEDDDQDAGGAHIQRSPARHGDRRDVGQPNGGEPS